MIHKTIHKKLLRSFAIWFPLVATLTLSIYFVYVGVYFTLRGAANDPQVQMAGSVVQYLQDGMDPTLFGTQAGVVIESGTSPYVVIYDAARTPIAGNGLLHGVLPVLPRGVYDHAKRVGEHRFTWQPERGVRQAVVLRFYKADNSPLTGFVLSGRSITEMESRVCDFGRLAAAFWFFSVLLVVGVTLYLNRKN